MADEKEGSSLSNWRKAGRVVGRAKKVYTKVKESAPVRTVGYFGTQDVDPHAIKRKIVGIGAFPLRIVLNILRIVIGVALAILIIFGFIVGGVFVTNCAAKGTCNLAATQIQQTIEQTGAGQTIEATVSNIWEIARTGGASAIGNTDFDVKQSDVNKYIKLQHPSTSRIYFEDSPIDVVSYATAYNLTESTDLSLDCSLKGYIQKQKNSITYNYPKKLLGGLGEETFSLGCKFEEGVKVEGSDPNYLDTRRGVMTLIYSGEAKSNWCVYTMPSLLLKYYRSKRVDPLNEVRKRDPECLSGSVGSTIPDFKSSEQLVFGTIETQPFEEARPYLFEVSLKEPDIMDFDGTLHNLTDLYLNLPYPLSLDVDDSTCAFERADDMQGYNYKLKKILIDTVNIDCSGETLKGSSLSVDECIDRYKEENAFRCYMRIEALEEPAELSTKILPKKVVAKAYALYSYELRESFSVTIKNNPPASNLQETK